MKIINRFRLKNKQINYKKIQPMKNKIIRMFPHDSFKNSKLVNIYAKESPSKLS